MQMTQLLASIHSQLGEMLWPFLILSVLMLMILTERCVFLLSRSRTKSQAVIKEVNQLNIKDSQSLAQFVTANKNSKNTLYQGVSMLLAHRGFDKGLREETLSVWLVKKKRQYTSGLKLLSIIGVISPLIGLLGTVLGLMEMFKDLAHTNGGIVPSDLAAGLGLAMSTTAAGLIIALPAILGAQLLQIWIDRVIGDIEHALNHCNLHLEGISVIATAGGAGEVNHAKAISLSEGPELA